MFLNHKIDPLLKSLINDNIYNKYRVLIEYGAINNSIENKIKSGGGQVLYNIKSVNCLCVIATKQCIKRLIELPEVKYICIDDEASLCSKNILHSNGIFIDNKKFHMLKDCNLTGKEIYIGIIDSGLYPHIDLAVPKSKSENFIDILSDIKYPYDDNGHGTFMSGIICGQGSGKNSTHRGIAIGSSLVMVKAFNKYGKGYASTTLYSFDKLYEISDRLNLKVICAPFIVNTLNKYILDLYEKLFKKFMDKNIVIVVPSGNNESTEDTIKGIALSSKVITVGGLNTNGPYKISDYSCCGSHKVLKKPDFVASSDDITSLNCDTSYISEINGEKIYPHQLTSIYTTKSGTSISCAFIAGICALLFEINPLFTFEDIYTLLKINSVLINDQKWKQGHGYINYEKLFNTDFSSIKLPSQKKKK